MKHLNCKMSWTPLDIVTTLFPVSILTKQHSICGGKYPLKTPGNAISETINFKMSLDALALKNMCLWCEFQSRLLFIISLLLKSFLIALIHWTSVPARVRHCVIPAKDREMAPTKSIQGPSWPFPF